MTGDTLFVDSIGRPDLADKAKEWVGDLRDTVLRNYLIISYLSDVPIAVHHFLYNKFKIGGRRFARPALSEDLFLLCRP